MAQSMSRFASDTISISDSVTVAGFAGRHNVADSIHIEDAATVLVGAGPIAVRASENATISMESREGSPIPKVDAGLAKNQWDLLTIGTGFSVGFAVGQLAGATVGALALYGWGQWRWKSRER